MTAATLRVSRHPPIPSPNPWFGAVGMPGGSWPAITMNATYYNGKTYFGYIDPDGAVHVSSYNHATGQVVTSPAIVTGLASDGHSAPSVLIREADQKILVAVAPHNTAHMYVALSTNAEDVSAFGAATDIHSTLLGTAYTYANLFQLSGESGKIYLFYRDQLAGPNNILTYATSTDGGATWTALGHLFQTAASSYCLWSIDSDSTSRIDIAISDGAVSNGETDASLYHFYYTGGAFKKSDGTTITATKPYAVGDVTKIYDGATNGSMGTYIAIASTGPTVAFAAADPAGWPSHPEKYWYSVYSAGAWTNHFVTDTAVTPTGSFWEPGIALSRADTAQLFIGRYSGSQPQMFLYTTGDGGTTWTTEQLTSDTDQPNVGPIVPRDENSGLRCLWQYGPQGPGTAPIGFSTQIRGYPNPHHVF